MACLKPVVVILSLAHCCRNLAEACTSQCLEEAGAQSLLQLEQGIVNRKQASGAYCKPWCHNDNQNLGAPWEHKCTLRRCEACPECDTTTTTTLPDLPPCPVTLSDGTAVAAPTVPSGSAFEATVAGLGAASFAFELAPQGLSIAEKSGKMTWQPDISQAGEQHAVLKRTSEDGSVSTCIMEFSVTA
eukprot:4964216-Amphidinium_carterae.2